MNKFEAQKLLDAAVSGRGFSDVVMRISESWAMASYSY